MKNITASEETVGILLANGLTKKEVASQLHKSTSTVCHQTDSLFKKTHSRNVADLTRFMIHHFTGIPVENILTNHLHC